MGTSLYTGAGDQLTHHALDVATGGLDQRETLDLRAPIQFGWTHPSRRWLYVATGHRGSPGPGASHGLWTLGIDPGTGALSVQGEPLALPARPIHLCVDPAGRTLYVAYNDPSSLTSHAVQADGSVGPARPQHQPLDTGIFAHQVRVAPDGARVVLVTRGNNASGGRSEDPGALKLYSAQPEGLRDLASIAPGGGYGFGPRDIDFHPNGRWIYASLERQNRLQVFGFGPEGIGAEPAHDLPTLADAASSRPRQLAGTLQVHPGGRWLYLINRADGVENWNGQEVFAGGENNIAVYGLDGSTGEARLLQHADTQSIYVRTFAIDASGSLLVAASVRGLPVRTGNDVSELGTALTMFRIQPDGRLQLLRRHAVDTQGRHQQWVGIVDHQQAGT